MHRQDLPSSRKTRQARLFEKIQGYNYDIHYLEGKCMYLSDFLSKWKHFQGYILALRERSFWH